MLAIPRLESRQLPRRKQDDRLEDCFEQLVCDLLAPEFPELRRFGSGGKDGAIDLSAPFDDGRAVFECKLIGEDGLAAARKRWLEVAKRLGKHLRDPGGPTSGQSQYGPWYRRSPTIRRYTFCVSSLLQNQQQRDALRDDIHAFFRGLAAEHEHLAHLASLEAAVLDWRDLSDRLAARPHLAYRWFPRLFPRGLSSLDSASRHDTFRAYLSSEKLPFYSRAAHLARQPPGDAAIGAEGDLLDQLFEDPMASGLVITGGGGVGKSRLALELGHLTAARGGVAARASRVTEETVEAFAEGLDPEQRAILVIDYVETEPHFEEAVARLVELGDEPGLSLRFVATCRTSYYPKVAAVDGVRRLDLSSESAAERTWLEGYRRTAIRQILEHGGLEASSELLEVCSDTPALAVFLAYLHDAGVEHLDLHELLAEPDFGQWMHRQVRKSFPDREIHQELALWMGLMPLPQPLPPRLRGELGGDLFDRLATDRWIEKLDAGAQPPRWVSAHDVLADQIVLSYLDTIRQQAGDFVERWLDQGRRWGVVGSVLLAVQRLADRDPIRQVDFVAVFRRQLAEDPEAWRPYRRELLRTPLLDVGQVLELMDRDAAVWQGAVEDPALQGVLGHLARRVLGGEEEGLREAQRERLIEWLTAAAPHVDKNNFLLTWALRLAPEAIQGQALRWLAQHPFELQTHFLLVAWLRAGLPHHEVAARVKDWVEAFGHRPQLSFLVKAWLDAGGAVSAVEAVVQNWLAEHGTTEAARFVLKSWFDAGGGVSSMEAVVQKWLAEHGTTEAAQFVLSSWLDAGGAVSSVEAVVLNWLGEHGTTEAAGFVLKSWLDAGGAVSAVELVVQNWLVEYGTTSVAGFVLKGWLNAGGEVSAVEAMVLDWLAEHGKTDTADFVLKGWLDAGGAASAVASVVEKWLSERGTTNEADFVMRSWLEAGGELVVVRNAAIAWLARHRTSPEAVYLTKVLARRRNLPLATARDVLVWCQTHPSNPDAVWRFSQLGDKLMQRELIDDVIRTAEVVLELIVRAKGEIDPRRVTPVVSVFWFLIDLLGSGPSAEERHTTDTLFADWLRRTDSFAAAGVSSASIQRPAFVLKVVDLLRQGLLDAKVDRRGLEDFCLWVDRWRPGAKMQVRPLIAYLRRTYPQVDCWDLVRFEQDGSSGG